MSRTTSVSLKFATPVFSLRQTPHRPYFCSVTARTRRPPICTRRLVWSARQAFAVMRDAFSWKATYQSLGSEITFFSHRLDPTTRESLLLRCGAVHVAHPLRTSPKPLGGVFSSVRLSFFGQAAKRIIPRKKDWPASILGGLIDFGSLVASWTQQNADMVGGLFQHCTKKRHPRRERLRPSFSFTCCEPCKCPIQPVGKPEITLLSHRLDPTTRESLLLRCGVIHVAHPSTKPRPCHWAGFFVGVAVLSKDGKRGARSQLGR